MNMSKQQYIDSDNMRRNCLLRAVLSALVGFAIVLSAAGSVAETVKDDRQIAGTLPGNGILLAAKESSGRDLRTDIYRGGGQRDAEEFKAPDGRTAKKICDAVSDKTGMRCVVVLIREDPEGHLHEYVCQCQ